MLLDDFFPVWTFREIHSIVIDGGADAIIREIKALEAKDLLLVNFLMRIRSLPGLLVSGKWYSPAKEGPLIDQITRSGFMVLGEDRNEILLGIIGKFWRPTGGLCRDYDTPGEFRDFHEPGWAKAGWNFHVTSNKGTSILTTETRIHTTDVKATKRFRMYWYLVQPGSGLIRRSILNRVKSKTESQR